MQILNSVLALIYSDLFYHIGLVGINAFTFLVRPQLAVGYKVEMMFAQHMDPSR